MIKISVQTGEYKLTWVGELKQEILKRHQEG